jgi:hypothetical protein
MGTALCLKKTQTGDCWVAAVLDEGTNVLSLSGHTGTGDTAASKIQDCALIFGVEDLFAF